MISFHFVMNGREKNRIITLTTFFTSESLVSIPEFTSDTVTMYNIETLQ